MMAHRNRFIDDDDLSVSTSLTHLMDMNDRDDDVDETRIVKHSPYYSETNFINLLTSRAGLCILDLNIRNIHSNFDELELFINRANIKNPISAICLNECWIDENTPVSDIQISNYRMFYQRGNRKGHGHCGLIIYVHEQFKSKEIVINQENTAWDYQCIEISHHKSNSKKYLLCNLYRIPGEIVGDINTFTDEFSAFLTSVKNLKHSAYICGDYNINLLAINSKRHYSTYFDNVVSKGFFPRITLPTRLQDESRTLIDNIFTNNIEENNTSKSGILINDIGHSDHKMIFTYQENITYIEKNKKCITIENRDEVSINKFIDELKILNIYEQMNKTINSNPQDNYEVFSLLVKYAKEKHLPKKEVKFNRKKHKKAKWLTNGILNSINTKNRLYKVFIQADIGNGIMYNVLKDKYKCYRATLRKSIREAKRLYYMRIFQMCRNDMKKTWSIINDTLNNNQNHNQASEFVIDNKVITDHDEIANGFNTYFVNIGRSLAESIQPLHSYSEYIGIQTNSRLAFHIVDENHVIKIIDKLKNKSSFGHDEISNKLIKRSKEVLVQPLTLIINQMLLSGQFPNDLKISRVKPLFKSGDMSLFSNYRPISLLSSFSKIFEYVIFYQVFDYMNENMAFVPVIQLNWLQ